MAGLCPRRLVLLCGTLGRTVGLELQASVLPLYPQTVVRKKIKEGVT